MSQPSANPPNPPARLDKVLADRHALEQAFAELLAMQHSSVNPMPLAARVSRAARPRQVLRLLLEQMAEYNLSVVHAVILVLNAASEATALYLLDGLRAVAYDSSRSDVLRLSAVTALCQREGVAVPDDFLVTLSDPPTAALQSLKATLVEATRNPATLLDYLTSLSASEAEVQTTFIIMMRDLGDALVVAPLRTLAQDDSAVIASPALEALTSLRLPLAEQALLTLPPTLRAEQRPFAERAIRKLQMATAPGQAVSHLPAQAHPASRAFLSLLDGRGSQMLWFAVPVDDGSFDMVSVLLNEKAGIKDAVGGINVAASALPQPAHIGALHQAVLAELSSAAMQRDLSDHLRQIVVQGEVADVPPELISLLMGEDEPAAEEPPSLEVGFDYARRLLLEAQAETWSRGDTLPVSYRLFSAPIWRSQPPGPDAALGPELPLPARLRSAQQLLTAAQQLLASEYFVGWFLETPMLYDEVERILAMMPRSGRLTQRKQTQLGRVVDEIRELLIATHYRAEQVEALQTRLTRMAEWLTIAGKRDLAATTLGMVRSLSIEPPASHPFILLMVQRGIEVAVEALAGGFDLRTDPARFGHIGL